MFGPLETVGGGASTVNRGRPLNSTSSAGVTGALSTSPRMLSKLRREATVAVISMNEPDAFEDEDDEVVLAGESCFESFSSYFSSSDFREEIEKEEERSPTEDKNESRFSDLVSVVIYTLGAPIPPRVVAPIDEFSPARFGVRTADVPIPLVVAVGIVYPNLLATPQNTLR